MSQKSISQISCPNCSHAFDVEDVLAGQVEKRLKDRFEQDRKAMQDKYSKFIPTESLTYESKLAVLLNQQLK